jgi:hypothetical protein
VLIVAATPGFFVAGTMPRGAPAQKVEKSGELDPKEIALSQIRASRRRIAARISRGDECVDALEDNSG